MALFNLLFTFLLTPQIHASGLAVKVNESVVLAYGSITNLARQAQLHDVTLSVDGKIFFPAVHISAYLDEISATAICRYFGYGPGRLGAPLSAKDINTFTMRIDGLVERLEVFKAGLWEPRGTSEVICSVLGARQ